MAKDSRFEVRCTPEWLKALDDWRLKQLDKPSRSEAIRRLVDAALKKQK